MAGMFNSMGGYSASLGYAPAPVSAPPTASTTTQALFGPQPGGGSGSAGSLLGALNPLKAFGLTFWSGVIAVGLLVVIRHSLPA